MSLKEKVKKNRAEVLNIAKQYGAVKVRVFGSIIRENVEEIGDLDLLVDLDENCSLLDLIAIKQELEDLLSCDVDVVTERALSPLIREDIIRSAKLL